MRGERSIFVRLSVRDAEKATAALRRFGGQGDSALRKIETASKPASRGLRTVDTASREAQQALRGFANRAGPVGGILANLGPAGLAAAGGIGAAAASVVGLTRAVEKANDIAKLADNIGITTDALQELQFVGDRVGVSQAQVNNGLEAFGKRLGELRAGTGSLNTLLNATDPAFKQMLVNAQSNDAALQLLFTRMAETTDQADRLALSAAAFGRGPGVAMARFARDGADGFEAMRQRARDLGIVLDEELLRKSELVSDQMDTLMTVLKTRATEAFLSIAGAVGNTADAFTSLLTGAEPLNAQAAAIAEGMESLATAGGAAAAVVGTRYVGAMASAAAQSLAAAQAQVRVTQANLAGAQAALRAARAEVALTGDRRALVVATSQAAAAQRAHAAALAQASVRARAAAAANRLLAGSLALVGGPVGAAALAVGGLVWLATTAETTTEATRNLKSASDAVQGVLDGQADASGRAAKAAREQGIAALEAARAEITAIEEVQAARKRTAPAGSVEPVPSVFDRQLARLKANIATLESKLGDLKDREKEAGKAGSDAGDEVGKAFSESSSSVRGLIDDFTDLEEQAAVLAGAKPLKALAATRDIQDARDMIADLSDEALAGLREKLDELGISGETLEDRVARLIKRKRDLEDSIESTEDALERERKAVDEEAAAYEGLFLRKEKVAAQNDKLRGQRLDELHEREKEAAKKAAEEIARQAERAQEQFDRIVERSSSRIVDIGADTIFGTLRGESRDFWQDFEDLALRTFSQIAAEAAIRPVVQPIVANVVGAMPGLFGLGSNGNAGGAGLPGAVGNLGNLASAADFAGFDLGFSGIGQSIDAFGASIGFGGSAATTGAAFAATPAAGTPLAIAPGASAAAPGVAAASVPGATKAGLLSSTSLTSTLGAAGIGAAGGGILADLVGLDSTGGSIGGGLGAGIGFAVGGPVGGIVGGLAGSLGGGALGDLFGKSKPSRAISASFNDVDGQLRQVIRRQDEASDEQKRGFDQLAQSLTARVNRFVQSLGATIESIPAFAIQQTRRDGTRARVVRQPGRGFETVGGFADIQEAAEFAIGRSLEHAKLSGLSDMANRVFKRSVALRNGNLEAVQQDIALARTIEQLKNQDEFSEAELKIRAVKERFAGMIDRADELGLATDVLRRARDKEIAAIREQAKTTEDAAREREKEAAAARVARDLGGLQDLVRSLQFGDSAVLTPDRQLSAARAEFKAAMDAVNDNEPGSLAGLAQAGTLLRDELRERFGSGMGFVDGARDIVEAIQRVSSRPREELIQQAQLEATERQTEVLDRSIRDLRDEVAALRRDIGADRFRPARAA